MKTLLLSLALTALAGVTQVALQPAQDAAATTEAQESQTTPAAPITVIALRHAEKGDDDPRDPALNADGQARAEALARLLEHAGVTHLFSTPYKRTQGTLAPLAKALGLEVVEYSPMDMDALTTKLHGLPAGSVAVVVGHSNTTPGVVLALGGAIADVGSYRGAPALDESEYDRAFVVTLASAYRAAQSLELRYGAAHAPKTAK